MNSNVPVPALRRGRPPASDSCACCERSFAVLRAFKIQPIETPLGNLCRACAALPTDKRAEFNRLRLLAPNSQADADRYLVACEERARYADAAQAEFQRQLSCMKSPAAEPVAQSVPDTRTVKRPRTDACDHKGGRRFQEVTEAGRKPLLVIQCDACLFVMGWREVRGARKA